MSRLGQGNVRLSEREVPNRENGDLSQREYHNTCLCLFYFLFLLLPLFFNCHFSEAVLSTIIVYTRLPRELRKDKYFLRRAANGCRNNDFSRVPLVNDAGRWHREATRHKHLIVVRES